MGRAAGNRGSTGIRVVYACDDNYAMLAGVSIASLLEHCGGDTELTVCVLCCEVSEENMARLRAVADGYRQRIVLVDADEAIRKLCEQYIDVQRWSLAAYARLLTPELLPDLERVLYLDCDTLVVDDVAQLWNTSLGTASCAAVSEQTSGLHKKNVRLAKAEPYYNSGVMLIDLDRWRAEDIIPRFAGCIRRHKGLVPYVDQGCVNEVCRGDILTLPVRYNVHTLLYDFTYEEAAVYRRESGPYSKEEVRQAKEPPVVVHFTRSFLSRRPGIEGSEHPYTKEWERVQAKTPWAGMPKRAYHPDMARRLLNTFYRHTPRKLGLFAAALVNSYIRPLMKR